MHTARPSRALVVSIHDVSPFTLQPSQAILDELRGLGVARCSLLVVPDHHRRGHFLEDKPFCDWLIARHGEGHEIIIHGYYHRRERKPGETALQKLMTRAYTADEGEFYDIDEENALRLVTRAQQEFASLGLHPHGFIAPAWLLSDGGEQALRKADIRYTTRLGNVLSLRDGATYDSASLVYSVRSSWRRAVSLPWNASLFRRLKPNPLLRVSIHPPDRDHAKIWRQIARYVALALEDRAPVTYWDWVNGNDEALMTNDESMTKSK
jgi:uncharacterized protein